VSLTVTWGRSPPGPPSKMGEQGQEVIPSPGQAEPCPGTPGVATRVPDRGDDLTPPAVIACILRPDRSDDSNVAVLRANGAHAGHQDIAGHGVRAGTAQS
jgi:hypothetical protein